MTGGRQTFLLIAALVGFGLLAGPHHLAIAQNEPEPEETPMEQPQAEPTEFVPVTAGDVESPAASQTADATPAPTSEATPASISSPVESASPAAEVTPAESRSAAAPEATPAASSRKHPNATQHATTPGGGAQIVPENSPFAGLNFGNQKGPTNITSDSGNLDYQNKQIIFSGHVHAIQAGGDLTSDKLRVQYGQDFNDIKMMYADGNVRMSQGTRWITSDHAVLDQATHVLTFYGNPVAHDQKDQITGSTIKVDLVSGKSTVDKPRVIIFPREGKNPDNGNAPDNP